MLSGLFAFVLVSCILVGATVANHEKTDEIEFLELNKTQVSPDSPDYVLGVKSGPSKPSTDPQTPIDELLDSTDYFDGYDHDKREPKPKPIPKPMPKPPPIPISVPTIPPIPVITMPPPAVAPFPTSPTMSIPTSLTLSPVSPSELTPSPVVASEPSLSPIAASEPTFSPISLTMSIPRSEPTSFPIAATMSVPQSQPTESPLVSKLGKQVERQATAKIISSTVTVINEEEPRDFEIIDHLDDEDIYEVPKPGQRETVDRHLRRVHHKKKKRRCFQDGYPAACK